VFFWVVFFEKWGGKGGGGFSLVWCKNPTITTKKNSWLFTGPRRIPLYLVRIILAGRSFNNLSFEFGTVYSSELY